MKLASLEIKGFKSFADKTVVNFNENVTGIVGPNGCGKSNIVDAIRWVLGEQKPTSLRSEKMENLIFNGTKKRRSAGIAEVSLTFEDTKNILPTEYGNVKVSRLFFRSGDSEYRLNNVPCRLKDIVSLFMDTGIGSDSYAIIELAMIDKILNDKDNSRRTLFEQAAGIEKYKKRKKETFLKLSGTEADIERVDDLLFEIENNLKTLKSQANRTKRYYKFKDKYKNLNIELARHLIQEQKSIFDSINKQKDKTLDQQQLATAAINKKEALLEKEKAGNVEKEQLLSKSQQNLNSKIREIIELENEKNLLNERQKYLQEKRVELKAQLVRENEKIGQFEKDIQELQISKAGYEAEVDQAKQVLTVKQQALEESRNIFTNRKTTLEERQSVVQNEFRQITELEKQVAVNKTQHQHLLDEISDRQDQDRSAKQKIIELTGRLNELEVMKEKEQSRLSSLKRENESIVQELEENEVKFQELTASLSSINRELDAKSNEYELTRNMVESMEGYPESIKFLKKEVQWTKDAPILSEIISTDATYKVAIENLLEPYLNYYVVASLEDAYKSIMTLSEAAKGRANFFVMDEFKDYDEKVINIESGIRALDVAKVPKVYRQLAAYLLDSVVITDDIKAVNNTHENVTYLNKEGTLLRSKYTLSGGSVGLFEGNKLGRGMNLDKLQKEVESLKEKSDKANLKLQEQEAINTALKNRLHDDGAGSIVESLNKISQELASVRTEIEYYQDSLKNLSSKSEHINFEIKSISEQDESLKGRLSSLQQEYQSGTVELKTLEEAFDSSSSELNSLNESFNAQNISFHQLESRLNSALQELSFKNRSLTESRELLTRNNDAIASINEQTATNNVRFKEMEDHLLSEYAAKEEYEQSVANAEEIYFSSRNEIQSHEAALKELYQQRDNIDVLIAGIKEKETDLKLELTSLRERLKIEFEVRLDDLIDSDVETDMTIDELHEKTNSIKEKLNNYGEINPMAVEAFEEIKERYQFILDQKEDLLEARDNLLQTIKEIDATAQVKFMEAFAEIKDHFKEVFRELFDEHDDCDLVLLDPEKPLESGIEITAQPKGKRPISINQLSGGEKSLTAIALLFSIYLLKPAPFCIFDEIDAPLDDVNISKFTGIIRKFSNNSQFIVVTHNKQTMTEVDVIYGVTMPMEGVSRVVPVDFRNLN